MTIKTLEEAISAVDPKFTSRNKVPVKQAVVKAEEWAVIKDFLEKILEPTDEMIFQGCFEEGTCVRNKGCYLDCKNSNIPRIFKSMVWTAKEESYIESHWRNR